MRAPKAPALRCGSSGCPRARGLLSAAGCARLRGGRRRRRGGRGPGGAVVVERRSALEWVFGGRHLVSPERETIVTAPLVHPCSAPARGEVVGPEQVELERGREQVCLAGHVGAHHGLIE